MKKVWIKLSCCGYDCSIEISGFSWRLLAIALI